MLVGDVQEALELVGGEALDRSASAVLGRRETDALTGELEEVSALVVGVVAVAEEPGEASDVALSVVRERVGHVGGAELVSP